MTKQRNHIVATPERMHQIGLEMERMRPAFKALRPTNPLHREFMALTKLLPIKHDGNIYSLHAELIADCVARINATLMGTAPPKTTQSLRKKWKS